MRKVTILLVLLLSNIAAFAQEQPEMADVLRSNGKIYIVVAVMAAIFIGLAIYLFSIDNRLKKIERQN